MVGQLYLLLHLFYQQKLTFSLIGPDYKTGRPALPIILTTRAMSGDHFVKLVANFPTINQ